MRKLFKGDRVVRTDNYFGAPEGTTGKIVFAGETHNAYRVHWDGAEEPDARNYYARELGLILEQKK